MESTAHPVYMGSLVHGGMDSHVLGVFAALAGAAVIIAEGTAADGAEIIGVGHMVQVASFDNFASNLSDASLSEYMKGAAHYVDMSGLVLGLLSAALVGAAVILTEGTAANIAAVAEIATGGVRISGVRLPLKSHVIGINPLSDGIGIPTSSFFLFL